GRSRRGMVHTGRFEEDTFIRPPHRPVDLPDQLAAVELAQPYGLAVPAGAVVRELSGLVVVRTDRGGVLATLGAVRLVRVVAGGRGAIVLAGGARAFGGQFGRGRVVLAQPLGRGHDAALGPVLVEDRVDATAL